MKELVFADAAAFDAWLEKNHTHVDSVRLRLAKKGAREKSISYQEALTVALCWGWIDGQKGAIDTHYWAQNFSQRRGKSPWSKINKEKAEALVASGKMRAPGLAEIERAKRNGRWEKAYGSAKKSEVPEDFAKALAAKPKAAKFFAEVDAANRYAFLYRIETAKKSETRNERIAKFVTMLQNKETLHTLRKKRG